MWIFLESFTNDPDQKSVRIRLCPNPRMAAASDDNKSSFRIVLQVQPQCSPKEADRKQKQQQFTQFEGPMEKS